MSPTPSLTVVYKVFEGLPIKADVYLPHEPERFTSNPGRQVLVYLHGGGLTSGNRTSWFPDWLHSIASREGYIFISADYRLLRPGTAHDTLADIQDLFTYVIETLSSEIAKEEINPSKLCVSNPPVIGVAGTSGGGFLAYLAGAWIQPQPKVVLVMYAPGGKLLTDHYLSRKTEPFVRGRPLLDIKDPQFAELLKTPSSLPPIADSPLVYDPISGIPSDPRMLFTRLLYQEALFLDYVTGHRGLGDSLRLNPSLDTIPRQQRKLFLEFNLSSSYSPTCLVHGSEDTFVLVEESINIAKKLDALGVDNKLIVVEGAEHSFDYGSDEKLRAALEDVGPFLQKHLNVGGRKS